jgi:hypothetical protein
MFDSRRFTRSVGACAAIAAAVIAASGAQAASGARIRLKPKSVMVNHQTVVTGREFPADTTIVLAECSVTTWIAPQQPCLTANQQVVTTNNHGAFETPFTVELCPVSSVKITRERCFIGEPKPTGVDTVELFAAAKVIVTWP